uniref:purine-nucleoside phosphorylase n=1 Tax=Panagrolaimus superbus TaxID=310955 RepID=A0A914Y101_9BILA
MTGGPNYETAAEIRFLHAIGGNAVGSSTCHEVAVARQCGIKVFGFSLITNKANSEDEDEEEKIDHEKVFDAAKNAEKHACAFVEEFVKQLKFEK